MPSIEEILIFWPRNTSANIYLYRDLPLKTLTTVPRGAFSVELSCTIHIWFCPSRNPQKEKQIWSAAMASKWLFFTSIFFCFKMMEKHHKNIWGWLEDKFAFSIFLISKRPKLHVFACPPTASIDTNLVIGVINTPHCTGKFIWPQHEHPLGPGPVLFYFLGIG